MTDFLIELAVWIGIIVGIAFTVSLLAIIPVFACNVFRQRSIIEAVRSTAADIKKLFLWVIDHLDFN